MSITITCLQCGASHKVNDRLAGRRVRCPECDTAVHVPELPDEPVVAAAVPVDPEPIEAEAIDSEPVDVESAQAVPVDAVAVETVAAEAVAVEAEAVAIAVDNETKSTNGGDSKQSVPNGNQTSPSSADDEDEDIPRVKGDEDELDMTPMVDVTFLLLIFFVVTASFQLQKSIFMPRQKTDAPSTAAVEEDPEEKDQVELQIDEEGGFLVLSADDEIEPLGKQALVSELREARGDAATKLIIKVQEQAKLQSLVDGMDAGTIAGYDELEVTQVEDF